MSTILINSKNIIPAKQIIDFFNGKYMFYVENPYFRIKDMVKPKLSEFLSFSKITNGTQLEAPKIYYKHGDAFTRNFKINMFEQGKLCKLFGAYSKEDAKPRSNNKFLVNLGKLEQEGNNDLYAFTLFHQQLAFALEFLIIAKLLSIKIDDKDTDETFINKFAEVVKLSSDNEDLIDLKNIIKNNIICKAVKENETEEFIFGFFDRFKSEIAQHLKSNKVSAKENSVIQFYGGKADNIFNSTSVKPCIKLTSFIKQEKGKEDSSVYESVNSKLGFVLKLPEGKNDFFATKIIKNRKALALTYDEYMDFVKSNLRYECKFIVNVDYDIRKYQSGPLITTKIDIKECIIKEPKFEIQSFFLNELDGENGDIQNGFDGDIDASQFLN